MREPSLALSGRESAELPGAKSLSSHQENAILRALGRNVNPADRGDLEPEMATAFEHRDLRDRLLAIAGALRKGRVLLPVLPHEVSPEGACPSGQLPQITLKGVTHARAVPVFSSLAALNGAVKAGLATALSPAGSGDQVPRPLPVSARALAIAALDAPGRMLLDGTYLLPRPLLNALACADTWVPSWDNPELLGAISRLITKTLTTAEWEIIPQVAGPDRLLVAVDPTTPGLAPALGELQTGINALKNLEAAADLLEVTPVPIAENN